jgi:hypothetical protein
MHMAKQLGDLLPAAILLAVALGAGPLPAADTKPKAAAKPAPAAAVAKTRPAWVDAQPGLIEEGYQRILVVGPYSTEPECHREIPGKLEEAVDEYALMYDPKLGPRLHIRGDTLRTEQPRLVREQYAETISSSVGPMRQIHLRVVFDRKFNRWLDQKLAQLVVARRVASLAALGGIVLTVLAVAWLWLRRGIE